MRATAPRRPRLLHACSSEAAAVGILLCVVAEWRRGGGGQGHILISALRGGWPSNKRLGRQAPTNAALASSAVCPPRAAFFPPPAAQGGQPAVHQQEQLQPHRAVHVLPGHTHHNPHAVRRLVSGTGDVDWLRRCCGMQLGALCCATPRPAASCSSRAL